MGVFLICKSIKAIVWLLFIFEKTYLAENVPKSVRASFFKVLFSFREETSFLPGSMCSRSVQTWTDSCQRLEGAPAAPVLTLDTLFWSSGETVFILFQREGSVHTSTPTSGESSWMDLQLIVICLSEDT